MLKSQFFQYGLSIDASIASEINANDGRTEIVVTVPSDSHLAFKTKLEFRDELVDGCCIFHRNGNEVVILDYFIIVMY